MVQQKLFPYDKNYILKEAQFRTKNYLLRYMIEKVKEYYFMYHNPLGLEDDTILKIKSVKRYDLRLFEEFYQFLAGVYRFKEGNNQLTINFDGKSHYEKYSDEWTDAFKEWIDCFARHENFLKAVLEMSIFYVKDRKGFLAFNRLKLFLVNFFNIKLYKSKGLVPADVA